MSRPIELAHRDVGKLGRSGSIRRRRGHFASFLVWFWLLRRYLASRLGVLSFMTPVFGIVLGIWLLDEPLEASFIIGSGFVLGGILMVSGHGWLRQLLDAPRTCSHRPYTLG